MIHSHTWYDIIIPLLGEDKYKYCGEMFRTADAQTAQAYYYTSPVEKKAYFDFTCFEMYTMFFWLGLFR